MAWRGCDVNDLLPELLVPPHNILVAAAGLLFQLFQAADFFAALASCRIFLCPSFRTDRKKHFWHLNLTCVLDYFGIIAMFLLEVIVHFHKIKPAIPQSLFSRTIDDVSGNNIQRRYPKYIWNRFSSSLKRGKFKWAKSKGKRKLWQFEQIQVKRPISHKW